MHVQSRKKIWINQKNITRNRNNWIKRIISFLKISSEAVPIRRKKKLAKISALPPSHSMSYFLFSFVFLLNHGSFHSLSFHNLKIKIEEEEGIFLNTFAFYFFAKNIPTLNKLS